MILKYMEHAPPHPFAQQLHPRITVLTDIPACMRHQLAAALRRAFRGEATSLRLTVESNGRSLDLASFLAAMSHDRSAIDTIDTIDTILVPGELPGAHAMTLSPHNSARAQSWQGGRDAELLRSLIETSTLATKQELEALHLESTSLKVAEETGRDTPDHAEKHALQQLRAETERRLEFLQRRAEESLLNDITHIDSVDHSHPLPTTEPLAKVTDDFEERFLQLDELEHAIDAQISVLQRQLVRGDDSETLHHVDQLFAQATQDREGPERRQRIREIDEYGNRYQQLAERNNRLVAHPRPPKWIVAQTLGEYEEAKGRFDALTYQAAQGIDVTSALARAKKRFEIAETEWRLVEHATQNDAESLEIDCANFVKEVSTLLGYSVEIATVGEALAKHRAELCAFPDARIQLCEFFATQHMKCHYDNVMDVTESWLAAKRTVGDDASFATVQEALAAAMMDKQEVERSRQALRAEQASAEALVLDEARLRNELRVRDHQYFAEESKMQERELRMQLHQLDAQLALVDAVEQTHVSHSERISELALLITDVEQRFALLQRRLRYLDEELDAFHEFSYSPSPFVPRDETAETDDAHIGSMPTNELSGTVIDAALIRSTGIVDYLLRRLSSLRIKKDGETLPVIIDAAFDVLDEEGALVALDAISRASSFVQVIYLASNELVPTWALTQSPQIVSVQKLDLPTAVAVS